MQPERRQTELFRTILAKLQQWLRFFVAAMAMLIMLLGGGFLIFASGISRTEPKIEHSADGIVALTGGALRIVDAFELLAAGRGRRLLISGVHPATTPGELVRINPEYERLFNCCIDLGHQALNTFGNALETRRWINKHEFRSLIVVTSAWHMPRAALELERVLPNVTLIPYPVISERMREKSWWSSPPMIRLFFFEYIKYIAAYIHLRLDTAEIEAS